ncbi:phosphonate metabolism protein/1,5-bisphosphokinase (PRPP-forming) PhnN [Shimia sp.]|uniref:phosphonate metabolism protein/1,5-bisphosphokinase (PRPP-forming) PhnN n=1 Tax=unclassified Shimia TaxID=2630038 RepID=UPI0025FA756F|nr:phosphonate metabolism protein/1,5-bisphosphokinase (PRPP-forming) PhnN [Shimia sp.]MCH2069312.1 phosphonate metabolism protein/1,5-bisphosphokinase (PRPP-forming) PhnN [Shimia sp.]
MTNVIGVVGPSGVGKDSVMEAMAALRKDITLVRRVITRPAGAGGEKSIGATDAEFDNLIAQDRFQMWWAAHGLRYGVPRAAVAHPKASLVLVNLSRGVLDQARAAFDDFAVLSLTAKTETLATRLAARGRETSAEIVARLERADSMRPQGPDVIEIANDGLLGETVQRALAALQPERV